MRTDGVNGGPCLCSWGTDSLRNFGSLETQLSMSQGGGRSSDERNTSILKQTRCFAHAITVEKIHGR